MTGAAVGDGTTWAGWQRDVAGTVVLTVANVLLGAAFGVLVQQSAAALVAYFVVPSVWVGVADLLGDGAEWFDVQAAFRLLAQLDVDGMGMSTVTALTVWLALPLTLGVVRGVRREVS